MSRYCVNCGAAVKDNERFCSSCGANQQDPLISNAYDYRSGGDYVGAYKKKSVGIAVVISFFIPGLGHIYIGKIGAGLVLFLTSFLLAIVSCFATISIFSGYDSMSATSMTNVMLGLVVISALSIAIRIYSMYYAYKGANLYNEVLVESGRPPW